MKPNPRILVTLAAAQIDSERKQWIEVIPTADKARNGPWFFTITRPDLETYAKSIRENAERIHIDYDHEGARSEGSTRAAGWFTGQAEVRDTDNGPRVLAEVQWTPAAAQQITDGEFRFISPEFDFVHKAPKTGLLTKAKEIVAATLTNRPFFRQLAPVGSDLVDSATLDALHERFGREAAELVLAGLASGDPSTKASAQALITTIETRHDPEGDDMSDLKAIATALGLAEDADEDTILEAAKKARAAASKQDPPKQDPPATPKLDAKMLETLGLAADATDEQVTAAVAEMKAALEKATGMTREALDKFTMLATRGVEADRRLAELEQERAKSAHEEERERFLARAVEEGRILPVHKEHFRPLYDLDANGVKATIEAAPKRSFRAQGSGNGAPEVKPQPRAITDRQGRVVVAVEDPEWLDKRAQEILRAAGKSMKTATEAEYTDALEQANTEATPVG